MKANKNTITKPLIGETLEDSSLLELKQQNTLDQAGFFSKLFIWWIYPTLNLASKQKSLELSDLEDFQFANQSLPMHRVFRNNYEKLTKNRTTLIRALMITFKMELIITFTWIGVSVISQLSVPLLIRLILQYIIEGTDNFRYAVVIIVAIIAARFINMVAQAQSRLLFRSTGTDAQTVVTMELLQKSLNVSFLSNVSHTSGEVINLMQVDALKLQMVVFHLGVAILIPIQFIVTLYLMFRFIGIAFLSGCMVLFLSALINTLLGKILVKQQTQLMTAKDNRTKCANQIFTQIKFIKINALEEFFKNKLFAYRKEEVKYLYRRYFTNACIIFSVWLSPLLILNSVFGAYVWLGNTLTPSNTFAIIGLFQMLQEPLLVLPMAINELLATNVSLKRIQQFFFTSELMADCIYQDSKYEYAVSIQNGNFYWNFAPIEETINHTKVQIPDSKVDLKLVLKDININIRKGQLVAIVGDVGAGKTSLLQAITGEMLYLPDQPQLPVVCLSGKVAYVSQKCWIQNATVRENILFGQEFNQLRYKEAVKYSCLKPDFKVLAKGDKTMIGEKGINLSGGQKARISLARALYSDADIYLLDDPISAVDGEVGNYIIKKCLNGYLKNKTTLLVTHALNNCEFTDYIYLMENGSIIEEGKFETMQESKKFKQIYEKFTNTDQSQQDKEEYLSTRPTQQQSVISEYDYMQSILNNEKDLLMIDEDRARGSMSMETYKQYYRSNGGGYYFFSLFIILSIWFVFYLATNYWIALWSERSSEDPDIDNFYYLKLYFYFGVGQGFFSFFRILLVFLYSIKSADVIHTKMINSLMYAPQCSFFERVPLGRILNRLTKDQNALDQEIFWGISWSSIAIFLVIANSVLYVYSSTIYILAPIAIYFLICWGIFRLYMGANRELQRLEAITKSPILSFFSESILGVSFVRIFNQQDKFIEKHGCNLDVNRKVVLKQIAANSWFIMMLGLTSLFVNAGAIIYCVFYSNSSPALTGLVLTYASQIDFNISGVIQAFAIFENGLVSFERCIAFTQTEPEQGYKALVQDKGYKEDRIESWPSEGQVVYKNYFVKYREDLAPALSDLSFVIAPRDKIGVVGRTGAGKSTVTLTLLRIVEAMKGQIIIDGIDISTLPLKQVRESITMIMQDATIFDGTLRDNIDPLKQRTDDEIMEAIDKCCLNDLVERRNGLDSSISEGGDNLSAGEKQLICIARAVLKRCKIVLIDEATANIDIETEHKIQQTIQTAFKDCTVITIAHRINTILYCDKILVIDAGHKKEFGYTKDLLEDKSSTFYGIYMEALSNQQQANKN